MSTHGLKRRISEMEKKVSEKIVFLSERLLWQATPLSPEAMARIEAAIQRRLVELKATGNAGDTQKPSIVTEEAKARIVKAMRQKRAELEAMADATVAPKTIEADKVGCRRFGSSGHRREGRPGE